MEYVYFPPGFALSAHEGVSGRTTERKADFIMADGSINVFLEWVSGQGFVLWGDGRGTNSGDLKHLLFARHKPSYYGNSSTPAATKGGR